MVSDAVLLAIVAAIPATLGTIVSAFNAHALSTQSSRLAAQDVKSDALLESTDTIHKLVNSGSEELKATIIALRADAAVATDRIAQLTRLLETANGNLERLTLAASRDRRGQGEPVA